MDYQYWNDFVNKWVNGSFKLSVTPSAVMGWRKPKYEMGCFLPEPWWGNNGKDTLFSVVVNLNPGKGGPSQQLDCLLFLGIQQMLLFGLSYQALMGNFFRINLPETENWHKSKRAIHMIKALQICHGTQIFRHKGHEMKHHLSVELIPWHTETVSETFAYIDENAKAIVDYSIAFAANQSLRIPVFLKTHGKVFIRMRWSFFENILINAHEPYQVILPIMPSLDNRWKLIVFKISKFKDVTFYCVWNANNVLPGPQILAQIFKTVS
jgi:hypothetical protein